MSARKKRSLTRRIFSSYAFVLLLLVILFFALRGLWDVYATFHSARADNADTEETFTELKEREEELEERLNILQTKRGVETEIRQRFNVTKPNEGVIYIVKDSERKETTSETNNDQIDEPAQSFWESLLEYVRLR